MKTVGLLQMMIQSGLLSRATTPLKSASSTQYFQT